MAKQPLISIITINRDNFEGLKRTINSVLNQTWKHFEYIVIDGDSKDGSAEYLKDRSSEIDYWVSEPDSGIYNAMNKGIKKASGYYLLFLNSGDCLVEKSILEEAIKYLTNEDIIYFDTEIVEGNKTFVKWTPVKLSYKFLSKNSLPHQGTFFKANGFKKIGFYDEKYKIISDWKYTAIGVLKYKFQTKKVSLTLSRFFKDGISSKERDLLHLERATILQNEFQEYPEINELRTFKKNILRSRSIKFLRMLGFLKWIND